MKITLRAARVNAGLTQQEAGKRIGVDRGTIIRWERGDTRPKADQLEALCALYQIPIECIAVRSWGGKSLGADATQRRYIL